MASLPQTLQYKYAGMADGSLFQNWIESGMKYVEVVANEGSAETVSAIAEKAKAQLG